MILSDVSIKRPVLATVMSLMLVLLGVISYQRLSVREYPNIDKPIVSVRTVYPGASAEIIESQITKPMEDSLAGIEGVRTLKSISREEVSQITVEFTLERDIDASANDVRDRVARVRGRLPDDALDPVVAKVEADAQAIIWIAFSSDQHTPLEITDYASRYVKDQLQTLPGVASVMIGGERRFAMRLWLDRARMAAIGVTAKDVEDALRKQNLEVPSGRIESQQREFVVQAQTDLRTPEEFNDLFIREVNGYPVRFRDIGHAEIGAADERNAVRVNGQAAVGLGVVKQSTANTLAVAEAVKAELPNIAAALPNGMKLQIGFDASIFVEKSVHSVYTTIGEALVLVVIVIFLFLRSLRATIIPFVTIPVSLIGAFLVMFALGYSINILTLLALVLAIGLVVDDAIVMLENIHRRIEGGMLPHQAALEGSKEIAFAVLAMSTTLAAVFLPLGFMTGNTGRLFTEFAWTLAGAVIISGFIALTLTPMMCSKILRDHPRHGTLYNITERWITALRQNYQRLLTTALGTPRSQSPSVADSGVASAARANQWLAPTAIASLVVIAIAACVFLLTTLKSELSPTEDRGILIGIMLAPEGATMDYTDGYARKIEEFYSKIPEIRTYFMVVAPGLERPNPVTMALSFVSLKPWDQRSRKQQEVAAELGPKFFGLPGVMAFPVNPPSLGQSFRNPPVQFVVQGTNYADLQIMVSKLLDKARNFPGLMNVDSDLRLNKPQLRVVVNRDKASTMGISVEDIGRTLETMLGGRQVTRFKREGDQYDVILQLQKEDRVTPADLLAIYVRGADGQLVQLSNLVQVQETVAPKELNHFNRLRSATISANVGAGYSLDEALQFLEHTAGEVLPSTARTELDGVSREFKDSGAALYTTFGLALAFIYLVLAAQFESFVDPFVILLTVPLAITGALLALQFTGSTLNVYSQIGMVMLIGLITKNGILIVEFANQLQLQGRSVREAVIEAAGLRLRPILMTTLTMIFAAIPLALATGAGAESRQQIGWVVVGGLSLGTVLTLFVIPAAYTLLARRHRAPV